MPKRMCLRSGCGRFGEIRGYCRTHASEQRKQNRSAFNSFYASKKWRLTRRHKLFQDPLCELKYPGCLEIANEVHHKTAMRDGGDPYAIDNLVSACKPCHSTETRREQTARGRVTARPSFRR